MENTDTKCKQEKKELTLLIINFIMRANSKKLYDS